ncbi:MFS transporter [Nonomuraea sp. NPDC000554]|uniref:MFS transporter n=1 Tax=Nonomuraea sp. NPDC000554 TaxID=3154259 RepID=UPI003329E330
MFIALIVAVVGGLGAPLITAVAGEFGVSLAAAQWTLTAPLLVGAIATPVLGRLGTGPRRRQVILATLATVVAGSLLTVVPPSFGWLPAGRVAQGAGLGLTALMMGVWRSARPPCGPGTRRSPASCRRLGRGGLDGGDDGGQPGAAAYHPGASALMAACWQWSPSAAGSERPSSDGSVISASPPRGSPRRPA